MCYRLSKQTDVRNLRYDAFYRLVNSTVPSKILKILETRSCTYGKMQLETSGGQKEGPGFFSNYGRAWNVRETFLKIDALEL